MRRKRFRRFLDRALFASTVILSLLCLRGFWRSDTIYYAGPQGHHYVDVAGGRVVVGTDNVGRRPGQFGIYTQRMPVSFGPVGSGFWAKVGFGYYESFTPTNRLTQTTLSSMTGTVPSVLIQRQWSLSLRLLLLITAFVPIVSLIRQSRRQKQRFTRQCNVCGYDCRQSPKRCPECGTAVRPLLTPRVRPA